MVSATKSEMPPNSLGMSWMVVILITQLVKTLFITIQISLVGALRSMLRTLPLLPCIVIPHINQMPRLLKIIQALRIVVLMVIATSICSFLVGLEILLFQNKLLNSKPLQDQMPQPINRGLFKMANTSSPLV